MRIRVGQKERDPRVRFVADKSGPEKPTKNGEYDVLRLRVGQQPHPPESTNCLVQQWARKSHQDPVARLDTRKSGPERATETQKYVLDPGVRCVMDKSWPERATKTRKYDLLRIRVGQKDPPRPEIAIRYR